MCILEFTYLNTFVGEYSEGVQMQHENTLKAHYSRCIQHSSVGDVATVRGRSRQPVHSTAKKDYNAALLRYGSIQSLPSNGTQYLSFLPSSHINSALKPQSGTAAETIYATPVQMETPEEMEAVDIPPPLPPPPLEFQSAASGSEVIPIATKYHHTYANVSKVVETEKSASILESSFRPGENARLSSAVNSNLHVTCGARESAIMPVPITIADDRSEDTVSGSADAECRSTSSCNSVSSDVSPLSSLQSSLLGHRLSSVSVSPPSCSSSSLPPPPPPLPPVNGNGLGKNLPWWHRRRVRQAGGLGACTWKGSQNSGINGNSSCVNSVSLGHGSINRAEVEVDGDQMWQNQTPRHLSNSADQTSQGMHMMVAPLKVTKECPQVARISKRSSSVDAAAQEKVVADSDHAASVDVDSAAGDDGDCSFLFLAERARQEYIRRRASVAECEERQSRISAVERQKSTTKPTGTVSRPNLPITGGIFKHVIARKADKLQLNKDAAVSDRLVLSQCHKELVPADKKSYGKVSNTVSDEQHIFPQYIDSKVKQNGNSSDTLEKPHGREHTSLSNSAVLPFSFEREVLESKSRCNDMVVLPPPPDFAECNSKNQPNTKLISFPACEVSVDHLELDMLLPPPPLEFSDGPNHVRSDFGCRPVVTWSVSDVAQWLDTLQLSDHRDMFAAHSIDGPRLMELGRSELIALGVSQVGQRMNLERAIKRAIISVPSFL